MNAIQIYLLILLICTPSIAYLLIAGIRLSTILIAWIPAGIESFLWEVRMDGLDGKYKERDRRDYANNFAGVTLVVICLRLLIAYVEASTDSSNIKTLYQLSLAFAGTAWLGSFLDCILVSFNRNKSYWLPLLPISVPAFAAGFVLFKSFNALSELTLFLMDVKSQSTDGQVGDGPSSQEKIGRTRSS